MSNLLRETVLLAAILAFGGSFELLAADAVAEPTVECSLQGEHAEDTDRIDPAREAMLLSWAVESALSIIALPLRSVAEQIAYVVDHNPKNTKHYLGRSAEDDRYYRYPDRRYYHPVREPEGTIRVVVTEKFIRLLDFAWGLQITNAKAFDGARAFAAAFLQHELTHALQYHTTPVRDIESNPELVVRGLVDRTLLKEQIKKIDYEHAAMAAEREIVKLYGSEILAFADAIEQRANEHPSEFSQGNPYFLLALERFNPIVGEYLRNGVATADKGGEFTPIEQLTYDSQVISAELVWSLKKANDRLVGVTKGSPPSTMDIAQLYARWAHFMERPETKILEERRPYLNQIHLRFSEELKRFHQWTGPEEFIAALQDAVTLPKGSKEASNLLMSLLDTREAPLSMDQLMDVSEIVAAGAKPEYLSTILRMMEQATEIPERRAKDFISFLNRANVLAKSYGGAFSCGLLKSAIQAVGIGFEERFIPRPGDVANKVASIGLKWPLIPDGIAEASKRATAAYLKTRMESPSALKTLGGYLVSDRSKEESRPPKDADPRGRERPKRPVEGKKRP